MGGKAEKGCGLGDAPCARLLVSRVTASWETRGNALWLLLCLHFVATQQFIPFGVQKTAKDGDKSELDEPERLRSNHVGKSEKRHGDDSGMRTDGRIYTTQSQCGVS
ncbi:hypothetical protein GCM10009000_049820 [Halobacterium noricense]